MGTIRLMIEPPVSLPVELYPIWRELAASPNVEPHHTIWLELVTRMIHEQQSDPKGFADDEREMLNEMLAQLDLRRH